MKPVRVILLLMAAGMVMIPVLLVVIGLQLFTRSDRQQADEAAPLVKQAVAEASARQAEVKKNRASLPADGPVPRDWNLRKDVRIWGRDEYVTLHILAGSFLYDTDTPTTQDLLHLDYLSVENDDESDVARQWDPGEHYPAEAFQNMLEFVRASKELDTFYAAIRVGLARPLLDVMKPGDERDDTFLDNVISACRLLGVRAADWAQQGRHDEALDLCMAIYDVADAVGEEPFVYVSLHRQSIQNVGDATLWRLHDASPFLGERRARVLERLDRRVGSKDLAKCMRLTAALTPERMAHREGYSASYARFMSRGLVESAEKLVACLKNPIYKSREKVSSITSGAPAMATATQETLSWMESAIWWEDRAVAEADVARAALALSDYKAAHGQYPLRIEAIEEDGGHVPIDPWSGKPVLYAVTQEGFTIALTNFDDDGDFNYTAMWRARK